MREPAPDPELAATMCSRPIQSRLMLMLALAIALPATSSAATDPSMAAFRERQAKLQQLGDQGTSTKALSDVIFASRFESGETDCSLDRDADTLPDCAETGTGTFVDVTDTGTDPANPDTDGDGLSDGEEVLGTLDGLDLPAMGTNPLRRDLLIEYDWFDDAKECGAHSHAPTAAVMARVAAMFSDATIENPDGSTGIHLIQDHGQGGVYTGGNAISGTDATLPGTFDATWQAMKSANFASKRAGYFHYVVLAHRYNGGANSSGYAELVGDDAIVSLACVQTTDYAARTITHEIGHNLGLQHGGFEACNGKPNYNSLMNYRYQFAGVDASCSASGGGRDGYSVGDRVTIDEAAVDEAEGVCGNEPIDWNTNGSVESGLALDLNPQFAAECGSDLRPIHDFDDWGNITLLGILDAQDQLKAIKQEVGCAGAPAP
jgi:hypothetical protein